MKKIKLGMIALGLMPAIVFAQGLSGSYEKQQNQKNNAEQEFARFYYSTERYSCANGGYFIAYLNNRVWFASQHINFLVKKISDNNGYSTQATNNGFSYRVLNGEDYQGDPNAKNYAQNHIDYEFDRKALTLYWKRSDESNVQRYSCAKMK
jgi:hypothetical protein